MAKAASTSKPTEKAGQIAKGKEKLEKGVKAAKQITAWISDLKKLGKKKEK